MQASDSVPVYSSSMSCWETEACAYGSTCRWGQTASGWRETRQRGFAMYV